MYCHINIIVNKSKVYWHDENKQKFQSDKSQITPYMSMGGEGGIYPLLKVQKNVTGQRFLED